MRAFIGVRYHHCAQQDAGQAHSQSAVSTLHRAIAENLSESGIDRLPQPYKQHPGHGSGG